MTETNKKLRTFLKIILPLLILVLGFLAFRMMGELKKPSTSASDTTGHIGRCC